MDGEFKDGYLYNGRHFIYDEFGILEKMPELQGKKMTIIINPKKK